MLSLYWQSVFSHHTVVGTGTGTITTNAITTTQVVELFEAGSVYEVSGLDEWCISRLIRELTPQNVLELMKLMMPHAGVNDAALRFLKVGQDYMMAHLDKVLLPPPHLAAQASATTNQSNQSLAGEALQSATTAATSAPPAKKQGPRQKRRRQR